MHLGSLFTNGAVFQREKPIVVWGWCSPRVQVKAELSASKAEGASAWDGRFELRLPALKAGGPFTLTVTAAATQEECTVRDVLIGEVWLAGGQSNMEFPLKTFMVDDPKAQMAEYLLEGGSDPELRMATMPHQSLGVTEHTIVTEWKKSNAANAPDFSAVGAWFGLALHKQLGVPVGIIHCSWGGTYVHSWISREKLRQLPCCQADLEELDARSNEPVYWNISGLNLMQQPVSGAIDYSKLTSMDSGNHGVKQGWAAPEFDDSAWGDMTVPGSWIGQKINGNGATWGRRMVMVPAEWAGKDLALNLGGIDKHDITYFNGVQVGATGKGFEDQYWNQPRHYVIPGKLVKAGANLLAIRGFSFLYDGSFGGTKEMYSLTLAGKPAGQSVALTGTWKAHAEYRLEKNPILSLMNSDPRPEDAHPYNPNTMHQLFDGMIRPLIPYTLRGAIWYQGENDNNFEDYARSYEAKFQALIEDWRFWWGQGDFPFYLVQLANWGAPCAYNWVTIQEAQRRVAWRTPNCGMITATDIGENEDIHPHNKKAFGRRLARLALHYTYGMGGVIPEGPHFRSAEPAGKGRLRLTFDWAEGLKTADGEAVRGFEIANHTGEFAPASAVIEGTAVLVEAAGMAHPAYVRYNWQCKPNGNLVNGEGLPTPTFNTKP